MKRSQIVVLVFIVFAALCLMAFAPYQQAAPPGDVAAATPVSNGTAEAVFVVELVAITAFFQKRFGLAGYALMGVAAVIGAVLWFAPLLATAFPAAATWINSGVQFVTLYFSAMGSVDFATTLGVRIATAKMTPGGDITVGSPNTK
jgi:hypothetical protein